MLRWANTVAYLPGGAGNGELMRVKVKRCPEDTGGMCTPTGKALNQSDILTTGDYGYYLKGVYKICSYGSLAQYNHSYSHDESETGEQYPEVIVGNPVGIPWAEGVTISGLQNNPDAWENNTRTVEVGIIMFATAAKSSHVRDILRMTPSKVKQSVKSLTATGTNASSPQSPSRRKKGVFNGLFLLHSLVRYGTCAAYLNVDVYLNSDARPSLPCVRR